MGVRDKESTLHILEVFKMRLILIFNRTKTSSVGKITVNTHITTECV